MKRPRILVVGSFVMDMIYESERFVRAGETILGTGFHAAPGGKGANQAMQAALLGADVSMAGKVGRDPYGEAMLASLRGAGVDTHRVIVSDDAPSGISNIQIQTGGRTQNRIIVIPGANMALEPDEFPWLAQEAAGFDMIILQHEIPMAVNEAVAAAAFQVGVPVLLNPAPSAALSPGFLSHLAYIAPNEQEAEDLTGLPVQDEASARRAAFRLCEMGVPRAIITLGERGAAHCDGARFLRSPGAPCPTPVDPTAAGDSFIGAFATAICAGMAVEQAMTFANFTASITVSRMGAQPSLPALSEVNAKLSAAGLGALSYDVGASFS